MKFCRDLKRKNDSYISTEDQHSLWKSCFSITVPKKLLKLADHSKVSLLKFFFDNQMEMRESFLNFTKSKKKSVNFVLIFLMQSPREVVFAENSTGSYNTNTVIQKS